MAALQVQTATQVTGSGATIVLTFSSALTAGNLVVLHIKGATTDSITSITDDKGNTYVVGSPVDNSTTFRFYQSYGVQTTGGATQITLNHTGAATFRVGGDEYSGLEQSNAAVFDVRGTGTGTGTAVACSTFAPATSGELIVASLATNVARTWTAGAGYTLYSGTNPITVRSQYKLSGTTSETAPASIDSSDAWVDIAHAYKLFSENIKRRRLLGVGL